MAYTRVNWKDLPSTETPINAENLNKMDKAIKDNDDKLLGNTSMGNIKTAGISINDKNLYYEYGTFTPSIRGETTEGTASYTLRTGNYVRIGNLVHLEIRIGCTLEGSAGFLEIDDLPLGVSWREPGILNVVTNLTNSNEPWSARVYGRRLIFGTPGLGNIQDKNWSSTTYIYISGDLEIA